MPDDDGQLLVDPMNALPKAETFADWGIQESWSIQVAYQIISEDVRAGLQVMVEPNGLEGRPERQALTPLSTDAEHR